MIVVSGSGDKQIVYTGDERMREIMEQVFRLALELNNGSRTKTARSLGLCIRTVRNWARNYERKEALPAKDGRDRYRRR